MHTPVLPACYRHLRSDARNTAMSHFCKFKEPSNFNFLNIYSASKISLFVFVKIIM